MGVRQRVKRAEEWQSFRAGIYQIVPPFRPSDSLPYEAVFRYARVNNALFESGLGEVS